MSRSSSCFIVSLFIFTSCANLTPDFYKTVDDIATDGTVQIQIDKEAFADNPDVFVTIEIKNKDAVR